MDETSTVQQTPILQRRSQVELCSKALLFVLHLRSSGRYADAQSMRQRCKELLTEFEEESDRLGFEVKDMQAIKYAIVAFIDETVLTSDWEHKDSWAANPLQLDLYKHYGAGEHFFELLKKSQTRPQILEVFYLCMALGFKGKYRQRQQEQIQVLIEETQDTLRRLKGQGQQQALLSPGGQRDEVTERFNRRLPLWIAPVATTVVGLFIYYLAGASLSDQVEKTLQIVNTLS